MPKIGIGAGVDKKPPALVLDKINSAVCAYSLEKLKSNYTNNVIRIRRDSDNAEQDFGFAGNTVNTSGLLSFVGGGNGYISKWYDQSGLNNHAVQTIASNQPKIVSNGSLITLDNKPAVDFSDSVYKSLNIPNYNYTVNTSHFIRVSISNDAKVFGNMVFETSGYNLILLNTGVGMQYSYAGVMENSQFATKTISYNNKHDVIVAINNSTKEFKVAVDENNYLVKTFANFFVPQSGANIMADYYSNGGLNGKLRRYILFNKELSANEINLLRLS